MSNGGGTYLSVFRSLGMGGITISVYGWVNSYFYFNELMRAGGDLLHSGVTAEICNFRVEFIYLQLISACDHE